jgi:hypothetical protein
MEYWSRSTPLFAPPIDLSGNFWIFALLVVLIVAIVVARKAGKMTAGMRDANQQYMDESREMVHRGLELNERSNKLLEEILGELRREDADRGDQ